MYFYQRESKPPPPLILEEIKELTTNVSLEKLTEFLEELKKPRKPKQRYMGWSSFQTASRMSEPVEGKENIEKVGKLLDDLLVELEDEKTELNKDMYSVIFSELYQLKKYQPFNYSTKNFLEETVTKSAEKFVEKLEEPFKKEQDTLIQDFIKSAKVCENLEVWLSKCLSKNEIDTKEIVVELFKKHIFRKIHVVKTVFAYIEENIEKELTNELKSVLQVMCFGVKLDYSKFTDQELIEIGKRFI